MRKISILFILFNFLFNSICLAQPEKTEIKKTDKAPVIDGEIEKIWGEPVIPCLGMSCPGSETGKIPDNKTKIYLLYDEEYLYLAFECLEENMKGLVTSKAQERDGSWGDDGIEIFLDPGRTKNTYYQILFNANGIITDWKWLTPKNGDKEWDGNVLVKTKKEEKKWLAEVKIPWSDFAGEHNIRSEWGINFCRWEPGKGLGQSWAPILGDFHQPEKFMTLTFNFNPKNYGYRLNEFGFGALSFGNNILSCKVKNVEEKKSEIVTKLEWQITDGELKSRIKDYSLKLDETKEILLDYPLEEKGRKGKIVFKILTPDNFCQLEKVKYFTIPSALLILKMDKVFYLSDSQADLKVIINLGENDRKNSSLLITFSTEKEIFRKEISSPPPELALPIDISKLGVGEYKIEAKLFDVKENLLESKEISFKKFENPF